MKRQTVASSDQANYGDTTSSGTYWFDDDEMRWVKNQFGEEPRALPLSGSPVLNTEIGANDELNHIFGSWQQSKPPIITYMVDNV